MTKSSDVNAVAAAIKKELPGATSPHLQAAGRPGQRQPVERQETGLGPRRGARRSSSSSPPCSSPPCSPCRASPSGSGRSAPCGPSAGPGVGSSARSWPRCWASGSWAPPSASVVGLGVCAAVERLRPDPLLQHGRGRRSGPRRPAASCTPATAAAASATKTIQLAHLDLGTDRARGRRHRHSRRTVGRPRRRLAGGRVCRPPRPCGTSDDPVRQPRDVRQEARGQGGEATHG